MRSWVLGIVKRLLSNIVPAGPLMAEVALKPIE